MKNNFSARATGRVIILEDGFLLAELYNGDWTDGDMTYDERQWIEGEGMKDGYDIIGYQEYEPGTRGFDRGRYNDFLDYVD